MGVMLRLLGIGIQDNCCDKDLLKYMLKLYHVLGHSQFTLSQSLLHGREYLLEAEDDGDGGHEAESRQDAE